MYIYTYVYMHRISVHHQPRQCLEMPVSFTHTLFCDMRTSLGVSFTEHVLVSFTEHVYVYLTELASCNPIIIVSFKTLFNINVYFTSLLHIYVSNSSLLQNMFSSLLQNWHHTIQSLSSLLQLF